MKVLVINSGSSSVKFQLIETDPERRANRTEKELADGIVEQIGMAESTIHYTNHLKSDVRETALVLEHSAAIEKILHHLTHKEHGVIETTDEIDAVGHRVVHGGEWFSKSTIINEKTLEKIRQCIELAPLHNPPNIRGYEVAQQLLPNIPHVAVFDTAFHQTMPEYAYMYALPYSIYERFDIRRYGFHGTSHYYVAHRLARLAGTPIEKLNIISIHLGNGSSIAAIKAGKSIDTSMGLTPLEGLVMGTRAGDIDPAIVLYLMEKEDLELDQANSLLNKHSGLIGISGLSNDMRTLLKAMEQGNERAKLAIEVYCYRIRKYIGAYAAALGRVDHIVFTAGIGENCPQVRKLACEGLDCIGIKFDNQRNEAPDTSDQIISKERSRVKVWVIPTNEELVIARDTTLRVLEMQKQEPEQTSS